MRTSHAIVLTLLCATTFWSCDSSDSSTTPNPTTTGVGWDEVRTIPILGRTDEGLILRMPEWIYGWCGTDDSAGVSVRRVDVDTLPSRTDTVRLRLDGSDKLFLREGSSYQDIDGLAFFWSEWRRASGSGPSVEGVWNFDFRDTLEVAYGQIPDSTLRRMQAEWNAYSARYRDAGAASQFEITSTSVVSRARLGEAAAVTLADWEYQAKDDYDLKVERVDARTLRYKGATETVTQTFLDRHSRRYTSSDPSRIPYTEISNPRKDSDCPEDPWFNEFMANHHRSPLNP